MFNFKTKIVFILLKLFVFQGIRWNSHDFNNSLMCKKFSHARFICFFFFQLQHFVYLLILNKKQKNIFRLKMCN